MRCLFVFEGGAGAILPLVPLAHALRSVGHEVLAGVHSEYVPLMVEAGVPAFGAPRKGPREYRGVRDGKMLPLPTDLEERADVLGRLGAQIAADGYHELIDLAQAFRPDLVIGGPLAYAAQLLAQRLDVPSVAVEFGMAEPASWHAVTLAELDRLGFPDVGEPTLTLSLAPESIRPRPGTAAAESMRYLPAELMRYVPYAPAVTPEKWMYEPGKRPRLWLSGGSRINDDYRLDYLTGLIEAAVKLDVELFIATPPAIAERVRGISGHARVGWLPFDILMPTCDLAVHHGGGSTLLGCVASGVPQVIIPYMPETEVICGPLRDQGAARVLTATTHTPAELLAVCQETLADPTYREAAVALRKEALAAPSPADTVARLERLVSTGAA